MVQEINLFEDEMDTVSKTLSRQDALLNQLSLPGIAKENEDTPINPQQDKFVKQQAKRIIEAILFASSDPVSFVKIREIVDTFHPIRPRVLREIIQELQQEYLSQQRSFRLEEIADGFLLRTCEEYSPFIDQMYRNKRTEKLSQASAEVLAIIAYKQPITRPQIESIRGVDCSGIIQNLLERQLIEPVGKLEAPGRPVLFGITTDFLKHFGLKDIKDLSKYIKS